MTREEALKFGLDNKYNGMEWVLTYITPEDLREAFSEGVKFADEYPKYGYITLSQFDELMDSLYDYLYEHNRNILGKKRGDSCLIDVRAFKTLIQEHKQLNWKL